MSLWTCAGCSTRYAPGAPACPHCRSTERADRDVGGVRHLVARCVTEGCGRYLQERRVPLRLVADGVLSVPVVLVCGPCGGLMSVSQPWAEGDDVAVLGVPDAVPDQGDPVPALPGDGGSDGAEDQ
jgi:hypothetical protein